jgi:hypothetical protein
MGNIAAKNGLEPQSSLVGESLALPARMDMAWDKLREARSPGYAERLREMFGAQPIPN